MNETSSNNSTLEIRDARQTELPAVVDLTKTSYAEFQAASPSAFWDVYMTSIEEAICERQKRNASQPFSMGSLWPAYCSAIKPSKAMIRKYVCSRCYRIFESTE